jgi:hypothetical protein
MTNGIDALPSHISAEVLPRLKHLGAEFGRAA